MTQPPRSAFAKAASAVLLLALAAPAAASTVLPFNNTGAITINVQGNATPYPSNITVSGVPTNFTRLEVQLNGFTHSFPDDVDVLLVGPQGQRAILMSDAGGPGPGVVTGQTLIFAQTAANPIPDATAPASGLFRPANYIESAGSSPVDTFPTPGPGALTDAPADLFVFNGFNPNGVWSLFVVDDANGDFGSISGGWTLRFTAPTVFTVTNTADTNDGVCNADCSLREALALAQDGDLVNFSTLFNTPQTINLLTALPNITRSITIQGTGANLLTVRRDFNAANFRIFNIATDVTNGVAINGMTITGGNAANSNFGGGIFSQSHLTLTNVHVTGNRSEVGGGGVSLFFAGGFFTNCTFSNNAASGAFADGGAISFEGGGRTLRVTNSTITGNRSVNSGGGIVNTTFNSSSRLEVTNSTIANNTAMNAGGVSTFNQFGGSGTATTTLRNTIVTGNSPNNLATDILGFGAATFQTLGFNLSDNYNGVFTLAASDITDPMPRLAPLALYGGQTPTHALLHGSPAINNGDASGATTDQRGAARVFGATADIGAVEMRPIVVANNSEGLGGLRLALGSVSAPFSDIQFDNTFFSTPQTIELFSGQLGLTSNVNIIGPGANLLTISGRNTFRVFSIGSGITTTLSGMTITGGSTSASGGGILNSGTLTVSHSTISGNTATFGGGIFNSSGILTVSSSAISGNTASTQINAGGGIENSNGNLTLSNSTVSGNNVPNGSGAGGGIYFNSNGVLGSGTIITNSTITNNSAAGANSASGVYRFLGTVTIRNSIIAGNFNNGTQPDVASNDGTGITSNGFNLIGNRGTLTFGATDQAGGGGNPILNPLLGPLQNNGGTTRTHALLAGSLALDKGNSSGATSDQRGLLRPIDLAGITNPSDGADIGAVELQSLPASISLATTVGTTNGVCATTNAITVPAGTTVYYCYTVTNTGGVTLGQHTLVDNRFGNLFTQLGLALTPGSSLSTEQLGVVVASTISTTTTNTGTWTAFNLGPIDVVTASASATVTVAAVAPTVVFAPTAGSTISFPTGTAGTATSSIAVSSSGGVAPGTVNVGTCVAPAGFTITNAPINLTGTAGGAQISGSINLSCTRGASLQTGTLSCSETPTPGTAVTRNWNLSCPAATVSPVAPTVTYAPVASSTITFPTGTAGTATSSIAVSSSGGVAPGTVNVASCSAPAGFTITNAPINLTGTAGGAQISGNINLSCTRGANLQTGTLSCSETPTPGSAVTRNWTLSCPVAAGDPIFGNGFEG